MGFQKISVSRLGPNPQYFVNFGKQIKEGMDLKPIRDYFQNKVDQYKLDVEGMVKIPDANADVIQPGLLDATQELKNEYVSLTQFRKTTATNSEEYIQAGKRLQEINGTLNQYEADVQRIDAIQKEFVDNPYMYDNILDGHHLSDAGEIYLDLSRGGMLDNMSNISGYEFRDKLYFTHRESGKEFSIDELVKPTTPNFEVREKVNKDFGSTIELALTKGKDATINEVLNIETYLDTLDQLETADLVLNNKLNYYTTAGADEKIGTEDDTDPTFMRSITAADSALYKKFFMDTFENAEDYLKDPNNDSWKNWIYPGFAAKAGLKEKQGLTVLEQGRKFRTQYFSDVLNQGINAANSLYEQNEAAKIAEQERLLFLRQNPPSRTYKYEEEAKDIMSGYKVLIDRGVAKYEEAFPQLPKDTAQYRIGVTNSILDLVPSSDSLRFMALNDTTQNEFFADQGIKDLFTSGSLEKFKKAMKFILSNDYATSRAGGGTAVNNKLSELKGVFNKMGPKDNPTYKISDEFIAALRDKPIAKNKRLDNTYLMGLGVKSYEFKSTEEIYKFIKELRQKLFNTYVTKAGDVGTNAGLIIKTDKQGAKEFIALSGNPVGDIEDQKEFLMSMRSENLLSRQLAIDLGASDDILNRLFGSGSDDPSN